MQRGVCPISMLSSSGFAAGELVHVIADCHIYDRHIPIIEELISRDYDDYDEQLMTLDKDDTDFYDNTRDNIHLEGYHPLEFDEKIPVAV